MAPRSNYSISQAWPWVIPRATLANSTVGGWGHTSNHFTIILLLLYNMYVSISLYLSLFVFFARFNILHLPPPATWYNLVRNWTCTSHEWAAKSHLKLFFNLTICCINTVFLIQLCRAKAGLSLNKSLTQLNAGSQMKARGCHLHARGGERFRQRNL